MWARLRPQPAYQVGEKSNALRSLPKDAIIWTRLADWWSDRDVNPRYYLHILLILLNCSYSDGRKYLFNFLKLLRFLTPHCFGHNKTQRNHRYFETKVSIFCFCYVFALVSLKFSSLFSRPLSFFERQTNIILDVARVALVQDFAALYSIFQYF